MIRWVAILFILTAVSVEAGGTDDKFLSDRNDLCTSSWTSFIEDNVPTGDGKGHGPDTGSVEWKSVVEFKLGIREQPGVPTQDSDSWCYYIDQIVRKRIASRVEPKPGPSFSCNHVENGSIEAMICTDNELSALDLKLAGTYAAASSKAADEYPPLLQAEQRGWIKGRNECWKSDDLRKCVRDEYIRRIAELQARYRLVTFTGPVRFICDGEPANEIFATFFHTKPRTLIAERGDSVSLMYRQPSVSASKYRGRNETFWEHQGEALVTWGYNAPEMRCKPVP